VIISSPLPIYCDQLASILDSDQVHKLTTFKIQSEILLETTSVFHAVFHRENSLQRRAPPARPPWVKRTPKISLKKNRFLCLRDDICV
jgi:hypothetical protein